MQAPLADSSCINKQHWCGELSIDRFDQDLDVDDGESQEDQDDCVESDDPSLEECFENLESSSNGNYSPFPSKIFAMLYLLVNSPHPAVSFFLRKYYLNLTIFPFKERKDPVICLVHPNADGNHSP